MGVVLTYIVPSPSPRCLLPKDSEEFKRLVEYAKNTHGATHTMCELEVMEIFKVARHGKEEKFWICSKTTNFCGILSQVGGCGRWVGLDGYVLVVFIRGCVLTRDIIGKNIQ